MTSQTDSSIHPDRNPTEQTVLYEHDSAIATITLNRPNSLNAVTPTLVDQLNESLDRATRAAVRVVILRGAGRAFCAGHDLTQDETGTELTHKRREIEQIQDITRKIRQAPFIAISSVQGYALGAGCEFALCADLVVASSTAKFGFPEVGVGLGITGGISHILPTCVGLAKAKHMVFLGDHIMAEDAERYGLVTLLTNDDNLVETTRKLANRLVEQPSQALTLAKYALDRGAQGGIDAAYATEVQNGITLHGGEDARRASEAFRSGK